MAMLSKLFTR